MIHIDALPVEKIKHPAKKKEKDGEIKEKPLRGSCWPEKCFESKSRLEGAEDTPAAWNKQARLTEWGRQSTPWPLEYGQC